MKNQDTLKLTQDSVSTYARDFLRSVAGEVFLNLWHKEREAILAEGKKTRDGSKLAELAGFDRAVGVIHFWASRVDAEDDSGRAADELQKMLHGGSA